MGKYEALFEDEDNIFGGTPKSKFWDIANQANEEIVEDEFDKIMEKFAVMEAILRKEHNDIELDKMIAAYAFEYADDIELHKKGLYIEFTGEIVCRLDS
ncbi:MAG: DUF2018 family protein [Arcobacteraceae bacterium]|nr:DUF2018 family protein [Arcobacteraceae bacterium]